MDNASTDITWKAITEMSKHENFSSYQTKAEDSLKGTLYKGLVEGLKNITPTIIAVWETDAIPNIKTFEAMISKFIEERDDKNKIASVSPMYTWLGSYAYPTHSHWLTDPLHSQHSRLGEIRVAHAVPFLFSVWEPSVFMEINNKNFRHFIGLDTDFGKHLNRKGWKHLRLINHTIEHERGGKNSHNNKNK